jgi:exoribonuclease R
MSKYIIDENGDAYFNGEKIKIQSHLLHGDDIEYKDGSYNLVKRNCKFIVGILRVNDLSFMGMSPKIGIYLKEFIPHDKKYPNMIARTKFKYLDSDIYVLVEPLEYDVSSKKIRCNITQMIGKIGDIKSEEDYLLYKYNCKYKKYPAIEPLDDRFKTIRCDLRDKHIYSIDPHGCEDIDDAFHIESSHDDKNFIVGIHIADTTSYIPHNSYIDKCMRERCSTLYLLNKRIDMMPVEYATKICSLKEKEERNATSLILSINKETKKIINYDVIKSKIIVKHNYEYDEFDKSTHDSLIYEFMDYVKEEYPVLINGDIRKLIKYDKEKFNSHYFVEYLMVLANKIIGEYISDYIKLVRVSNGLNGNEITSSKDPYGISLFLTTEASKYAPSGTHKMIGIDNYVHFTSPIRRYADVYTHRLINYKLKIDDNPQDDYDDILEHMKKEESIKKLHRDIQKIKIINELTNDINHRYEECYFVSYDEESKKLKFYITELKIVLPLIITTKKMEDFIEHEYNKEEGELILKNKDDKYRLSIGMKIPLELYIFSKNKQLEQKIKLKIVDTEFIYLLNFDS